MKDVAALPGGDLVAAGLRDLDAGLESVPAMLVSVGAPRLRRSGFVIGPVAPNPEHRLYQILLQADPDAAHARYNALVRRLVSFERSIACAD